MQMIFTSIFKMWSNIEYFVDQITVKFALMNYRTNQVVFSLHHVDDNQVMSSKQSYFLMRYSPCILATCYKLINYCIAKINLSCKIHFIVAIIFA